MCENTCAYAENTLKLLLLNDHQKRLILVV